MTGGEGESQLLSKVEPPVAGPGPASGSGTDSAAPPVKGWLLPVVEWSKFEEEPATQKGQDNDDVRAN